MNERSKHYRHFTGVSPCGSGIRGTFVKDLTTNPPSLKKVGETDQYAITQSFKNECDINRIIARYQAGDISVLSRVQGLYSDISGLPNDPTEMMQLGFLANSAWDNLDPEIKSKFNNDKSVFVDTVLNGSIEAIFNDDIVSPDPFNDPVNTEVPNNESN